MKTLIYKWKAYNYMDIIAGFDAAGIKVDIIEHSFTDYDGDEEFKEMLLDRLKKTVYDFVFTVNYFGVISQACHEVGVPYVIWSCDNPLISLYHKSAFYDENRIFTFDKSNYYELKSMGIKNVWHLPLTAGFGRIDNAVKSAEHKYLHDISFVGSLYEKNSYDAMESYMSDYLRGYLDGVIRAQMNISGGYIIDRMLTTDILMEIETFFELDKSKDSLSDLALIFSTTVLGFKVAALTRVEALNMLSKKFDVTLFSNSQTSQVPLCKSLGSVDYWTMLPIVFNNSRINLNFTIPNIKSGVPLRVWDIMASGGLCMTNFTAELLEHFKPDEDIVIFEDMEELRDKCDYYLKHDEARERIARSGMEKVRDCHKMEDRINYMVQKI